MAAPRFRDDLILLLDPDPVAGPAVRDDVFAARLGQEDRVLWLRTIEEAVRFMDAGYPVVGLVLVERGGVEAPIAPLLAIRRARCPAVPLLLVAVSNASAVAHRARAGYEYEIARGPAWVEDLAAFVWTVDGVLAGKLRERAILERRAGGRRLTHAEWAVLELSFAGLAPEEIAAFLGLSVFTVRTHARNARVKCGFGSMAELYQFMLAQARTSRAG